MEEIIDFGQWVVPTKWEDITLKQFQEIERFYEDKDKDFDVREVLHIFTNKGVDEINALPLEFLEEIMSKMVFLQEKPEEKKPTNSVEINGERYTIHTENKLKVGEYVGADTAMKGDKHNYAAILAILCRKDGEAYDSKFENEIIEDRIKLWEKQPVINVMPLIGFFLMLSNLSLMPTLLSSSIEEMVSHIAKNIETLHQNGEISKRSMKLQMKKLKKLQKSIKCI